MRQRVKVMLGAVLLLVASITGITAATAATSTTTLYIGTHNTLHGTSQLNNFAGVIGWQELDNAKAWQRLRTSLPNYDHYFPASNAAKEDTISWRKDRFSRLHAGYVLTHKGEAGVTPNRYVTWVQLRDRADGKTFLVLNTHFISGAWSGHPERQARWNTHYGVLKSEITKLATAYPSSPVFVVGDFNRAKELAMPNGVSYVHVQGASGTPIDQSYAQKAKLRTWTQVSRLQKWGSDHYAYRFKATF